MRVQELIEKRAKVWETAKNFVDTHEDKNGNLSAEDKEKVIAENFAGVILKMNDLEAQVKDALAENADKIAAAKSAIETVNI